MFLLQNHKIETTFIIFEKSVPVEITFKRMSRILFRTRSGKLIVSAPYRTPVSEIEKAIPSLPKKFLNTLFEDLDIGEDYIYLLGEKKPLQHVLDDDKKEGAILYRNQEELEKRLKSLALQVFQDRVRYYENKMGITNPYKVKVHKTVSRYGSNAKRTHTLSFSLTLIHYPLSVIDAVVVHELAHDRYFDHSPSFYKEVLTYYPSYYEEMKRLKGGHSL